MSVIFDLDKNSKGSHIVWEEDFRRTHSVLNVTFRYDKFLFFDSEDNTLQFLGGQWTAMSWRRTSYTDIYEYQGVFYPKGANVRVVSMCSRLQELASKMGVVLSRGSTDFVWAAPIKNMEARKLLLNYRYDSLLDNYDDVGRAQFLFVNHAGLHGKTYLDVSRTRALDYDPLEAVAASFQKSYLSDSSLSFSFVPAPPEEIRYLDMVNMLMGEKVEVESEVFGQIGSTYRLVTGDKEIDKLQEMVLVYQKFDNSLPDRRFALTFARLLI
jgi:hypothetical protein